MKEALVDLLNLPDNSSRINMVMEEEASVYLSNSIIRCSTSNQPTNYGNKVCTNKFYLNREVYLKYVFVYDEEHVKFLDCVVVQVRVPE